MALVLFLVLFLGIVLVLVLFLILSNHTTCTSATHIAWLRLYIYIPASITSSSCNHHLPTLPASLTSSSLSLSNPFGMGYYSLSNNE